MVNTTNKYLYTRILIAGAIFCSLLLSKPALAFDKNEHSVLQTTPVMNQGAMQKQGVLMSRPDQNEEIVKDFMTANNIKTINDYSRWVKNNIEYKNDTKGQDTWEAPAVTLDRKYGDCEDFAFLNALVLRQLGYTPQVIAVVKKGDAHAMCTFKAGDKTYVFDNNILKQIKAKDVEELAKYFFSKHNYLYFLELNFASRNWDILYAKK